MAWQARGAGLKSDDDEEKGYRQAPATWILSSAFHSNGTNYMQGLLIGLHQCQRGFDYVGKWST